MAVSSISFLCRPYQLLFLQLLHQSLISRALATFPYWSRSLLEAGEEKKSKITIFLFFFFFFCGEKCTDMEKLKCFRILNTRSSSHFIRSVLYSLILYLVLFIRNANGLEFDPLIQLPHSTSELFRNDSSISTTVLYIDDFGAKGNGRTDDTRVWE